MGLLGTGRGGDQVPRSNQASARIMLGKREGQTSFQCVSTVHLGWVEVAHLPLYLLLGIDSYSHAVFFTP